MEEYELIRLARQGKTQAFSSLVEKYRTKMFNLAYSMTKDSEIADDLAQEIFIKAYRFLSTFKFKSGFGTWLYRIGVNVVKDFLRKESRMRKIMYEQIPLAQGNYEDELDKKEKEQEKEQQKRLISKVLSSLPQKHQLVLSLRDIQGLSYGDIAKILNIAPGTVDSRLYRARRMLRKKVLTCRREG